MYGLNPFVLPYANNTDPLVPELWAMETLVILEENMVIANLVHRDFENELARFGDVVHTRRPGEFEGLRKTKDDDVTIQDATATDVLVPLNQHIHISFKISDEESSLSFQDLVDIYLRPAGLGAARAIDRITLGQFVQFAEAGNIAGRLGFLDATNGKDFILETREVMNINKAYMEGRRLILNPQTETELLKLDIFTSAERVGDEGTALREASLGRKLGFDMFMSQNMTSVMAGQTSGLGEVNNAAGYPAGTTVMTVDGAGLSTANMPLGTWFTVEGDNVPHRLTAFTGDPHTSITFTPALQRSVVDNADITFVIPGAVNFAAGYGVGYAKEITIDGFTVAPQVGQPVRFANQNFVYTIIKGNGLVGITLDRPLDQAIADNDRAALYPVGNYNFAFHRDALALVVRPLALPKAGVGAISGTMNDRGLSVRSTITYDGRGQGHLVTLDMLCGVAILDTDLGAVLLG